MDGNTQEDPSVCLEPVISQCVPPLLFFGAVMRPVVLEGNSEFAIRHIGGEVA